MFSNSYQIVPLFNIRTISNGPCFADLDLLVVVWLKVLFMMLMNQIIMFSLENVIRKSGPHIFMIHRCTT